jgi:hypothetical protein
VAVSVTAVSEIAQTVLKGHGFSRAFEMHLRALEQNPSHSAHTESVQGGFFSMKKPL